MAYSIRTIESLSQQARLFFTQAVPGSVVKLWANTFTVFGKVFALLDFEHELRRQYLYRQLFASTADQQWLARHGYELGLSQDPGNAAVGSVTVAAPDGILVPAGLQFVRPDGATYSGLAPATAIGASVELTIQSDLAGSAFNMEDGDTLELTASVDAPISLGTQGVVTAAGLTGGVDPEPLEAFRARILYRKRNVPQGGSASDYVKWVGEALASVRNVYVDSFQNDSRSVWVCITVSDQPNGIPTSGELAMAQAYVDDPIRRPVTARVFVVGPNAVPVPIVITNLRPDTPDARAAIAAEIAALSNDVVQPATPSAPFVLYREEIEAAIKRAVGGSGRFTLTSPSTDLTFSVAADMPVFNSISYA